MTRTRSPLDNDFLPGELWVSCDGSHQVKIASVKPYRHYARFIEDYEVVYSWIDTKGELRVHSQNAWNFQVYFKHHSDL